MSSDLKILLFVLYYVATHLAFWWWLQRYLTGPVHLPVADAGTRVERLRRWFQQCPRRRWQEFSGVIHWIRAHKLATFALFVVVVGLPALVFVLAIVFPQEGGARTFLEGLTGTWPSQEEISKRGLAFGVALIIFMTLAAPTALGVVLAVLIERAERRIHMQLDAYLIRINSYYRGWLPTMLAQHLHGELSGRTLSQAEIEEIQEAARRAMRDVSERWIQDTRRSQVSDPRRFRIDAEAD